MKKPAIMILALAAVASYSWAECKIEVNSTPALPVQNLLKNSDFKEGMKSWSLIKGTKAVTETDDKSGVTCLKISGDEKAKPGVYQRVRFNQSFPAGSTVFMGLKTSFVDTDNQMNKPSIAINVYNEDKSSSYLHPLALPFEPHDWTSSADVTTLKKAITGMTFYLCYYNQIGESKWTDVVVKIGNVKLNINVTGDNIQQVRVLSALKGEIFDSGKLKAGTSSFKKELEVGVGCAYYVEVKDASGKVCGKRYPENVNAPTPATADSFPVFSRFNEEKIMPLQQEAFTFTLPSLKDKEVYLELDARLNTTARQVAGYTGGMSLSLNGKTINSERVIGREQFFTRVDGRKNRIFSRGGFVVFYSPWYFGLSEDNSYCPIDIPGRNPFHFKIKVTDLVKAGENVLNIKNIVRSKTTVVPLWCANARIVCYSGK
jgi:hypothetical protein